MNPKALATIAILLSSIPVNASTTIPTLTSSQPLATTESAWQVRAALYGWGTALDGDVTLRGRNVPVDSGFDDVLDNLDFALMGAVEISNGPWSFLADLFYAELSTSNTQGRLAFSSELDQFIGNFVITRNMIDTFDTRFDVYVGARVMSIDSDLDITRTGIIRKNTFSGSASESWADPIIGMRFQQELPNSFFLRAAGDIGGFGMSSDFTWQALGAVGYHINDAAALTLGYRGIGTDYENGPFAYDVVSHGVMLGIEYKF